MKKAYFIDDKDITSGAEISYGKDKINIDIYYDMSSFVGRVILNFYEDIDFITIKTISREEIFKNPGVFTAIMDLVDYLLKDYVGDRLYSEYYDLVPSIDKDGRRLSQDKIYKKSLKLYKKNDFTVVLDREIFKTIKPKKSYRYIETDGDLFDVRFYGMEYHSHNPIEKIKVRIMNNDKYN